MVLVSFSSQELVRKLGEWRAAEDSYCSFGALELGFEALQSGRDGAEVGRQYGVDGGAQKRLWAEDHRLHRELLQQGASESESEPGSETVGLWPQSAAAGVGGPL